MAYTHKNAKGINYYLHSTNVTLVRSKKNLDVYFFAKDIRSGALNEVPDGYKVVENKRTGLPVLKKK